MTVNLTQDEYWGKKWDDSIEDVEYTAHLKWTRRYLYRSIDKILKNILTPNSEKNFIEVGCGGGKWLVYSKKRFAFNVSGIDFSSEGCKLAQRAAETANIKANIFCGDFFSFDFRRKKFDVVFSDGFLEHFSDPQFVLSELDRLVKPGGLLITIIPNLRGLHSLYIKLTKKRDIFETHRTLERKELYEIYERLGYTNIRIFYAGSIIPKVIGIPSIFSKLLNIFLIVSPFSTFLEGEKISSTCLIIGKKTGSKREENE